MVVNSYTTSTIHSLKNFQFDIKTKKLSLSHKNIHHRWDNDVARLTLGDLKVKGYIDVRDGMGNWHSINN